jgi:hypothetical protein
LYKPKYELADIIKCYQSDFASRCNILKDHLRVLHAIEKCRTSELGGHVSQCDSCSHLKISYNSCRNRHCPKCQSSNREQWVESRNQDLIPATYFHVVFTLPQELNKYCIKYPKEVYNILFKASKATIEDFAKDKKYLGAQTGMISILHTWGQNLSLHPHVHMIVPGGGIDDQGRWIRTKSNLFLFPVKAMSVVYKNKFINMLSALLKLKEMDFDIAERNKLFGKKWVVYAKQPFAGPSQVIEYLGRYTHKIAISNHRIQSIESGKVSFTYKDYAHGGVQKIMTLECIEFLRRFCMHILPPQFTKIRHYGILSSRNKAKLRFIQFRLGINVAIIEKSNWKKIYIEKYHFDPDSCPCCKTGKMIRILSFSSIPPPIANLQILQINTL